MARGFTVATPGLYGALARSFHRSTLAAGWLAETVDAYDTAIAQFGDFLVERGMPTTPTAVTARARRGVHRATSSRRCPPTTAATRYRSCSFFAWCVDEGEIAASPMARMQPAGRPGGARRPMLSDDDLRRAAASLRRS